MLLQQIGLKIKFSLRYRENDKLAELIYSASKPRRYNIAKLLEKFLEK